MSGWMKIVCMSSFAERIGQKLGEKKVFLNEKFMLELKKRRHLDLLGAALCILLFKD